MPPANSEKMGLPCNLPCHLLTTPDRILALDYDNKSTNLVISQLSFATALDYNYNDDYKRGFIFWTDRREKSIRRSNMDGTDVKVIHNSTEECYGLAVDWNSLQLYGTDITNDTIWVSDFDGGNRRIVLSLDLDRPTGIVVDPHERLMFWNAWGSAPKVEKSNLDGTQRVAIVTSNLTWPSGITLDRQNKLVYWVDESRGTIESFDYGGNNRTLLFQQKGLNFYSVTFISPYLFITGWRRNWIYKVDVSNGTVLSVLSLSHGDAMGLVAIDSYRRPSAVTWPALMSPANSIRHGCPGNATVYPCNTECQFSCLEGYKLIGSSLRKCQDNGLWSGRQSHCESITCPMLSLPFNAVLLGCNTTGSEMFYGTKCKFFCKEGSVAASSTVRGCSENGTWTGRELVCTCIELRHSLLVKFL
ncbi:prolow-density lipoprotein receptor-related protein 1-like isoform X2 [Stylophora pistillata]|uniref:prolow-density lipoprotein receptor-related protein 1-like isoform X2 n=1 Tax=Stylophora pistillata TaxID=50429 RepID=UPI000C039FDF|nr:prolow-density lipoprotein receptor-related protein 1-like isoform X2 [Stylophora pistillata]